MGMRHQVGEKKFCFDLLTFSSISLDIQQQIDRLQSIVLRLASNIDTLNHQSNIHPSSPMYIQQNIKHELIDDVRETNSFLFLSSRKIFVFQNEPSEQENEEDHEDETSDVNHRSDFPASTSTNLAYPMQPMPTKTIVNNSFPNLL